MNGDRARPSARALAGRADGGSMIFGGSRSVGCSVGMGLGDI